MEARWHDERGELAEAAAIYQRVVDRIANLPERRRPAGSDLNLYLSAAAAGLVRVRANLGDLDAAQRLCEQLELWDAEDADRWRLRVHVLRIDQGLVDEGLSGLQQLAESDPDKFDLLVYTGERGNRRAALRPCRACVGARDCLGAGRKAGLGSGKRARGSVLHLV